MKQIELTISDLVSESHSSHNVNNETYQAIALEALESVQIQLESALNDSFQLLVNVEDGEPSIIIN